MHKALPAAATIALGLTMAGTAAPALADQTDDGGGAVLSVLHGVPDMTVDVYINGERTVDDISAGELAGPMELPAGDIEIAITAADAENDSEPVIDPVDVTLEDGGNYTAAVHPDADGEPTATAYTNDTSALEAGQGRLTVRHVAAAPAVDVWANGEVAVEGLENPGEASLEVPAGTVEAAVSLAGETDPVIGPQNVEVAEGAHTIAYAWGSTEDDSLHLGVQTVDGMDSAPDGVPTGNTEVPAGGQAAWLALGAGALVALAAGATFWTRRKATVRG